MSELMSRISKENIRGKMNLLFTLMKFISMLLDMASDNQMARETLTDTASGLFEQTAVLFHDISAYAEMAAKDDEGFQSSPAEIESG